MKRSLSVPFASLTAHACSIVDLRCASQHLHLPVKIFALVVVHKERQGVGLSIALYPIMKRRNVRRSPECLHVVILIQRCLGILELYLFARDDLGPQLTS